MERTIRDGRIFKCKSCEFELDTDLNDSRNIAKLGMTELGRLNVNQPNVTTEMSVISPHLEVG